MDIKPNQVKQPSSCLVVNSSNMLSLLKRVGNTDALPVPTVLR